MDLTPVLPDPFSVSLRSVTLAPEQITLVLTATPTAAMCPLCGQASDRVHSHYSRHLADLPCQGIAVQIHLHVRRFFCPNGACARRIFTERLPRMVARYARRTCRLQSALEVLGLVLGGEVGGPQCYTLR